MQRSEIVQLIGQKYLISNIENDEFNYKTAFKEECLKFSPIKNKNGGSFCNVDLRFVCGNVTILIETKRQFCDSDKVQLDAYLKYEKKLTNNKVIGILANTDNDKILVYKDRISDETFLKDEIKLKTAKEYAELFVSKKNDKAIVMANTYKLNELLHKHGIREKLRSQFVGTCLLFLKNTTIDVDCADKTGDEYCVLITGVLASLLDNDINKAQKLVLLQSKVLEAQDIKKLKDNQWREILVFIKDNILPFIYDKSTQGQDLLNLFFVTFNKYVGKADKNQAFTPDHITDFMSRVVGIDKNSRILDPCCGSGSFLVKAMTLALDDCQTDAEKQKVKKEQIFGIEWDESVFGLATTNMLIHSDGNSNIYQGSCFDHKDDIRKWRPNVVLMNPPYNATRQQMPEAIVKRWPVKAKQDPTKGFHFVKYILDTLNEAQVSAKLAVLLPMACAIGSGTKDKKDISEIKKCLLMHNTLLAVFSLPNDVFYPGASASVCCMVFEVGKKHNPDVSTFFGYYKNDGFKKRKNLGRVEQLDEKGESIWKKIEENWLNLYHEKKAVPGLSILQKIDGDAEWLCEAYMDTDYSSLTETDFQCTINDYLSYLVKEGQIYES